MNIRLYKDFTKRINSTKRPSGGYTEKDVKLKENTNFLNPGFQLTNYDPSYNYVYVPSWGRYYFLDDFTIRNNNIYELSTGIDVLASHKERIGSYNCYVDRCSNEAGINEELYDSAVSSTENIIDTVQAKTNLWTVDGTIVCRTINAYTGVTTYLGSFSMFAKLFNPDLKDISGIQEILAMAKYFLCSPSEYVLDTYLLPIPASVLIDSGKVSSDLISAGWWQATGDENRVLKWNVDSPIVEDTIFLNEPAPRYQDWRRNSTSFTEYTIYLPSIGTVPLDNKLIDSILKVKYSLDIYTGDIVYYLYSIVEGFSESLVGTYKGNIKAGLMTGSVMPNASAITSGVALVAGAMSGNPIAIGSSVINSAQNILTPTPSVHGGVSSCVEMLTDPSIIITRQTKDSADNPNTAGKPCGKNVTLSHIPGYIQCSGASINIAGTKQEKEIVNGYLNGGFYYE